MGSPAGRAPFLLTMLNVGPGGERSQKCQPTFDEPKAQDHLAMAKPLSLLTVQYPNSFLISHNVWFVFYLTKLECEF